MKEGDNIFEIEKNNLMEKQKAINLNPLVLAYIGDGVYELYIRKHLILTQKNLVNQLHKNATAFVKAKAQAEIVHNIIDSLTEEEINIVKRARNTKTNTWPKNTQLSDYKYATGFEALLGYHYLVGNMERLENIISRAINYIEMKNTKE